MIIVWPQYREREKSSETTDGQLDLRFIISAIHTVLHTLYA